MAASLLALAKSIYYDILHELHGIKMRFHHCNDE